MTLLASPDILYGHTPGHEHPSWVALLTDLPDAADVLEQHTFRLTEIDGLPLFVLSAETDERLATALHLASYVELSQRGHHVMRTADHPVLPDDRLRALLDLAPAQATTPPAPTTRTQPNTRSAHPGPAVADTFRNPPGRSV
ncbi:hypothetical protein ACQPZG_31895 [Streptomyces sp. CA-294286]|uniref:hypothetical protein n=1 Tax=Streptomyces sp. CA-294286 TaxID=3240070 RepID=UPI003D8D21A7